MSKVRDKDQGASGVDRRRLLVAGAFAGIAPALASPYALAEGEDLPSKGDHLVLADGDGKSAPLTVDNVKVGGDIVTAVAVTEAGVAKNSSRFAKLLLFRFDPKKIDDAAKPMSVDGVIAYSAICTHQGCEINAWDPGTAKLRCFCHGSEFLPEKGGQVANGPATKQLPMLPLSKGDGGKLMVADGFTAQPGPPKKTRL